MIDRGTGEPVPAGQTRPWDRQRLLAQLSLLLQHQPVAVLTGESGAGKFFLAEQYRHHQQIDAADCGLIDARSPSVQSGQAALPPVLDALTDSALVVIRHVELLSAGDQQVLLHHLERAENSARRWLLTTRVDLQTATVPDRFQPSLFYRIRMLACPVPPVRQRPHQLAGLIRELVQEYVHKYRRPVERIDESFMQAIQQHHWPGNVRELRHAIERAVIECTHGVLQAGHLPVLQTVSTCESAVPGDRSLAAVEAPTKSSGALDDVVASTERTCIQQALEEHGQSRTAAARELGISRVTLYNKMKKLGIG